MSPPLPPCSPEWVIDSTFELFMDLGASDELCDFPVVYASGERAGGGGLWPVPEAAFCRGPWSRA